MDENLTPAMKQYYELKNDAQDAVLFFRMGDFYEMFGEDAHIAHSVLGVALTTRNKNAKEPIHLAGIPFHAKEKYLPKLVQAGYKVAIAEQVSDPKLKGIVKRAIVRIVTPGTLHLEMDQVSENAGVIIGVCKEDSSYGLSTIDPSSHVWSVGQFDNFDTFAREIYKISPSEVILEKELFSDSMLHEILQKKYGLNIYYFTPSKNSKQVLLHHFGTKNLEGFGIESLPLSQATAALVLEYLQSIQKHDLGYLDTIKYQTFSEFMDMDDATIRSLDILYNFFTKSSKYGTLLGVMDATKTAMGGRFLRDALVHPLQDVKKIQFRYDFIQAFVSDRPLLDSISGELKNIADMDTLLSRLALGRANPRDMLQLKRSLKHTISIVKKIQDSGNESLKKMFS